MKGRKFDALLRIIEAVVRDKGRVGYGDLADEVQRMAPKTSYAYITRVIIATTDNIDLYPDVRTILTLDGDGWFTLKD